MWSLILTRVNTAGDVHSVSRLDIIKCAEHPPVRVQVKSAQGRSALKCVLWTRRNSSLFRFLLDWLQRVTFPDLLIV